MPVLSEDTIAELLTPYLVVPPALVPKLSLYLDLLLRWNARTNLTAIREPEEIVQRHFGESLFAASHLSADTSTLLDLGSGAGFPGVPIALLHPKIKVTLAESQNKKATFLREVTRTLELANVEIWAGRVEAMPQERHFDTVALRAVDKMEDALAEATRRAEQRLLILTSSAAMLETSGFPDQSRFVVPESKDRFLLLASKH